LEETLEYLSVDGRTTKRIKRQGLVDFISPRIEELFTVVQEELRNSGFGDRVAGGGVILTGGGSLLKGMAGAAEQILELPVRHGLPQGLAGRAEILGHPSYATALGLLHYRHLGEWARSRRAKPQGGRLGSRIKSLIEEFF
jgi:cell division protein FtsA